jgi:AcrR family transcriptional regulator
MRVRDESKIASLLVEARKMVVEEGFDGLSMQKLAKAAGVSPATIYIYFEDRDDLLVQLYKQESDKFFEYIFRDFDPEMDFATGLAQQWKSRASYVIDNIDNTHFMEYFKFSPLHAKALALRDPKYTEGLKYFVHNAIRNKQLVDMPFEVYWSVAFAPLYNLVHYHKMGRNMAGEPFVLTEEMLMQTLSLVLKGLRPEEK